MALSSTATAEDVDRARIHSRDTPRGTTRGVADRSGSLGSAVSWGAGAAGAVAAASLSLILLVLGVGLGSSSVSTWARDGAGAMTIGVWTIGWLALTPLLALAMGGHLAGRWRTEWTRVHTGEVYFRTLDRVQLGARMAARKAVLLAQAGRMHWKPT